MIEKKIRSYKMTFDRKFKRIFAFCDHKKADQYKYIKRYDEELDKKLLVKARK
jgi:hypothetical protein